MGSVSREEEIMNPIRVGNDPSLDLRARKILRYADEADSSYKTDTFRVRRPGRYFFNLCIVCDAITPWITFHGRQDFSFRARKKS